MTGNEGHLTFFNDILVFLFAAGIIVPLMRLLKIPSVVSFIFAGLALGPHGLGSFTEDHPWLNYLSITDHSNVMPFAELGVLFLLFLLGLEFSFNKLARLKSIVFGAGTLQVALSAFAIGLAASSFGLNPTAATIVGLSLALSSTAIVTHLLNEQKRSSSPVGQTSIGVLLFQDILVAPILIFVAFTAQESANLTAMIVEAFVEGTLAVAIIFVIGRFGLRKLFSVAASSGGRDFLMALTLLTVIGSALLTEQAGLSFALGAFLAGILLGETEFKHQTEVDLEPFKGVLLGLFFMTVGMGLDFKFVISEIHYILLAVVVLVSVKFVVTFLAALPFVSHKRTAFKSALLLAPAGEFGFVIFSAALAGGALAENVVSFGSSVIVISMLMTNSLSYLGNYFCKHKLEKHHISLTDDLEGHVIIAGFGRVGRVIAEVLSIEHTKFIALDSDQKRVLNHTASAVEAFVGDASRPELLKNAKIDKAAMFIVTVDDEQSAERMVKAAKRLNPNVQVLVRAQDADHAKDLYSVGADYVVPDAIEAGLQLAAKGLEGFGYTRDTVRSLLMIERDKHYKMAENDSL